MKIAFLRKRYTPYGGAERYLDRLVSRLIEMGHEVHIYAHRWDPSSEKVEGGSGARFHKVPVIPVPSFLEALSFAFFSRRLLQEEDYDLIHSFERTLYQDIYRAGDGCHREWLIRRKKMDPLWKRIFHPVNPLHQSLLFLEGNLFRSPRTKRIITPSRAGKEEIQRHYGIPDERIEIIPNGIELNRFHPQNRQSLRDVTRKELGIPAEAPVLLFLGSGFRRKGLDSVIAAMPLIRKSHPNTRLVVAGKDQLDRYRIQAERWGIRESILFLGPTLKAEALYAASDLFVLPTFYDPFSNACLEAMASGVPVLTTPYNGVADFIQNGKNGFLVEPSLEGSEVASRVIEFFKDREREKMGEEARRSVMSLDMDAVIQQILQVYENVQKG